MLTIVNAVFRKENVQLNLSLKKPLKCPFLAVLLFGIIFAVYIGGNKNNF